MGSCVSRYVDSDYGGGHSRQLHFKRRRLRKRHAAEFLASESRITDFLYRLPERICSNGGRNNVCLFTQQGRKGTNQDAMVVWENFASRKDTTFCGIFDGHGPFGHLVARKVRDSLPLKLLEICSKSQNVLLAPRKPAVGYDQIGKGRLNKEHELLAAAWRECLPKAYSAMDKELKSHPTIDCFCSGTTAVTMLVQGKHLLIGNVGDSRAVMGSLSEDNYSIKPVQLTIDLKPNLPVEAERIRKCRGRVFALDDEPEVPRLWLPHDDAPGLAMARALGDFCLKDFGLISVPEMTCIELTEKDQFVVLASDGVWDVLSNEEVVETVWKAGARTVAARTVVEKAVRGWRLKYPTSKVDDCAVVCLYFKGKQGGAEKEVRGHGNDVKKTENCRLLQAEVQTVKETEENRRISHGQAINVRQNHGQSINGKNTEEHCKICHGQTHNAREAEQNCSIGQTLQAEESCKICRGQALNTREVKENCTISHGQAPNGRDAEGNGKNCHGQITSLGEKAGNGDGEAGARNSLTDDAARRILASTTSSRRSLAECLSLEEEEEDEEWSALEGVARVNSLLTLPRFLS